MNMITIDGLKSQTSVSAKTKINEVEHRHNLHISWEGISADDLQKLAQRTIVHMFHTRLRAAPEGQKIPEGNVEVKATDYRLGQRVQRVQMSPEAALAQLSPEQLTELLKAKGLL